jgi:protein TonB
VNDRRGVQERPVGVEFVEREDPRDCRELLGARLALQAHEARARLRQGAQLERRAAPNETIFLPRIAPPADPDTGSGSKVEPPAPAPRAPRPPSPRAPAPRPTATLPEKSQPALPTPVAGDASKEGEARIAEPGASAAPIRASERTERGDTAGAASARLYGEHDVDRAAGPLGGIRRPAYPPREQMLGREGRVSLLVTVDPSGAVRDVEVTRSAGEAFDSAARRAVEATPFRPAERSGLAVASTVTVNVSFELD